MTDVLRVIDLSRGGLLVETLRPLQHGGIYTVQIETNALVSRTQARVVRVSRITQDLAHVALAFVALDSLAVAAIDEMLQSGGSLRV